MPSSNTTNMGLIVPTVGQEPGPAWANDINSDLGILDQHNHTTGQGVPIPVSGLNINTDFSLNGFNLITVNTVRFQALSMSLPGSSPNLGCLYVAGVDLYYNDISGNVIKITSGGAVNATSSGISSGTATASFVGGVLVVDSNVNTPGNIKAGSYLMGDGTTDGYFLTLQPPILTSSFSLTYPSIPASPRALVIDTSGNITASAVSGTGSTQADVLPSYGLVPSGSILPFGGASAPAGYVLCDGTSYLRTTYPNLFSAIGTAYGTADGTHFNVPDLRGMFIRGVTGVTSNDPDAAGRTANNTGGNTGNNVGSQQGYQLQSHDHVIDMYTGGGPASGPTNAGNSIEYTWPTHNTGGNETRPINVYVNYIIKT